MKKLAELKARRTALKADAKTLIEAAENDNDGIFTAEQNDQMATIDAELDSIQADIEGLEATAEWKRKMSAIDDGASQSPAGANTVNDPNPETTAGYKDIGEFAASVYGAVKASKFGGRMDERLVALTDSHEGGGGNGEGFELPPQFRDDIYEVMPEFDEFGGLIDEEPTSKREVKLSADETTPWGTTGVKAYWIGEGQQGTKTNLDTQGRSVPLHKLFCMATASDEMLSDAIRLQNRLTNKAAMAIAWKKNLAIAEGSGAGQPKGWFNSSAMITVAKESGQSADTINATNVIKMYSRLLTVPGDKPFWLANTDTLPQLMTMTVGDKPIWMPPNGLADAPGGFLLGLPVKLSEYAKTLGDLGDIQLISPKGYYGARQASGLKFASSIHLYFDYDTEAFRWTFRYGGQPHLSAPVSPANGSATKSHFVALAERA